MGGIVEGFDTTYRDYVVDGVPSSGPHEPAKADIRALGRVINGDVAGVATGVLSFATIALRDAATGLTDGKLAYVFRNNGSASDAANGWYQWNATGSTWVAAAWVSRALNDAATAAAASATGAATSENNAATSATSAADSATSATASETNATTAAALALGSAAASGDNAASADTSRFNAATSATNAAASLTAITAALAGLAPGAVAPILAATTALLAAVTAVGGGLPANGTEAFLTDAGRFGLFRFTSGNQSANVTADPYQAIWIAPSAASAGGSGAWQRVTTSTEASVTWWGAVAGDTAAGDSNRLRINACIAYCAANRRTMWIPAGDWYIKADNGLSTGLTFNPPANGSISVVGECRLRSRIIRAPIADGVYPPSSSAVVWLYGVTGASYSFANVCFDGNEVNHPLTNPTVAGNYFTFACNGTTREFAIPNSSLGFAYLTSGGVRRCLRPHEYAIVGSGASRALWTAFFPANGDTLEFINTWHYEQQSTIRHATGSGGTIRGIFMDSVTFANRVGDSYLAATQSDVQHWQDIESLPDRGFRPRSDIQLSRLPLSFKISNFTLNGFEMEPALVRQNVALALANGTIRGPWDMAGDVAAGSPNYCTIDAVNVRALALPSAHPLVYCNFYNMRGKCSQSYFGALERIHRPRDLTLTDCEFSHDTIGLMQTVANPVEIWTDTDDVDLRMVRPNFKIDADLYPLSRMGTYLETTSANTTSALRRRVSIVDPVAPSTLPGGIVIDRQADIAVRVGRDFRPSQYAVEFSGSSGSLSRLRLEAGHGFAAGSLLFMGVTPPTATTAGDTTVDLRGSIDAKLSTLYGNYGSASWVVTGANPTAGSTVTLNGHVITFVDTAPSGQHVLRMGSGQTTAQMLVDYINKTPATGLYATIDSTIIRVRSRAADTDVAMSGTVTGWTVPAALVNADPTEFDPGATGIEWRGRIELIVDADPGNVVRGVPGAVARRAMPESSVVNEWHFRNSTAQRTCYAHRNKWTAASAF